MADRNASRVGLQLLLTPAHRGADQAKAAAAELAKLGFNVTGIGEASLAISLSRSAFRRLLGREPTPTPSTSGHDAWSEPNELPVPEALAPWVEGLFEARRAQRY